MPGEKDFPVTFKLNTGAIVPAIGLGTWKSKPGEVGAAVKKAIEVGYRHIDCAPIYGNEAEVGEALADCFKRGLVKREELFVTSKLWPTNFAVEDVEPALRKTLEDLKLDYLDLFLTHIPIALKKAEPPSFPPKKEDTLEWDMLATWRAMQAAHKKGLTKAIGVSNFTVKKLERLLAGKPDVVPAVNQVELHPAWRQDKLLATCASQNIHVTAYSPLGSKDRPRFENVKDQAPVVLDLPSVKEIASKMGKSPAQVVLRWGIQRGTSVLPKSVSEHRIKENFDVLNWSLSHEDFETLTKVQPQVRVLDFRGIWVGDNLPVATVEEMWDGEV